MNPLLASLAGGAVIGLSASILLYLNGRVAGVSGIAAGAVAERRMGWRAAFVLGLVAGGILLRFLVPGSVGAPVLRSPMATAVAGLLVGFGTQLGAGCTSGHGVCGLSAGSSRSLAAVLTFMGTGALTVFLVRHALGVLP
jgi:uncharacterized membrane protein YedE/YeeE